MRQLLRDNIPIYGGMYMIITNKINMDLQLHKPTPVVCAVQQDSCSRNLEITLFSNGKRFSIPASAAILIRYRKSDGTGGEYDTLPDGSPAWSVKGSTLTVTLAPQVLTAFGAVMLSVTLIDEVTQLSTFQIKLDVHPLSKAPRPESQNYYNVTGFLPAPVEAKAGQYLKVSSVDENGKVTAVEAVSLTAGGKVDSELIEEMVDDYLRENVSTVPEYVTQEADSVIRRILDAQGRNTFTMAVISDLHYGSNGYTEGVTDYRDGVNHACQALKYMDERIKLDAVAVLGDYTDGLAETQMDTALADFKDVNQVLDKLRFAPNLRLPGNHDFVSDGSPLAYRCIGAYSDGTVEWGDPLGGYFLKDFHTQKIRVICLNTSEQGNSGLACSQEQYQWFVRALDLTGKENTSDWSILILSHIPLDMWPQDGKYRFAYILDAYQNGTSWSDGTISCDFTGGKNQANLVGNIHGHVHNFKVSKLYLGNIESATELTDVWRMATPNACFGGENKNYTGYQEGTTYPKTADSAKDTAFCVYCIDLDSRTIQAICYGAGYDRTLTYGETPQWSTYTVKYNLSYVTSSNTSKMVTGGKEYTTTLTAVGDITGVSVTMGGVDVTSSVYAGGVITIPAVTGNIVITASCTLSGGEDEEPVNQLAISTDGNGNIYNGVGYKANTRYSASSQAESSYTGLWLSGYIPLPEGTNTFYLKNVQFDKDASNHYIWYFTSIGMQEASELSSALVNPVYDSDNHLIQFTAKPTDGVWKYIRIQCGGFDETSAVTVNTPIE